MNEQFELSARYYDAFLQPAPVPRRCRGAAGADCPTLPAGGPRAGRGLRQPRARPALRSALSGRRAGQQRDLPGDRSAQDRRTPRPGAYHLHSMEDFSLDASYDAIVCLFSSIGYLPDADALRRTMHTFSDHLAPGGVIVVEPWLSAQQLGAFQSSQLVCADGLEIARIARHRVDGDKLTLWLHYLAGGPDDALLRRRASDEPVLERGLPRRLRTRRPRMRLRSGRSVVTPRALCVPPADGA